MKKLLAVIVAFAMVLSMGVMAFAATSQEYADRIVSDVNSGKSAADINAQIDEDLNNKVIYGPQLKDISETVANAASDMSNKKSKVAYAVCDHIDAIDASKYPDPNATTTTTTTTTTTNPAGDESTTSEGAAFDPSEIIDMITSALEGIGDVDIIGSIGDIIGGGEPADPISSDDYAQAIIEMINNGDDVTAIATQVGADLISGAISVGQISEIIEKIQESSDAIDPSKMETFQSVLDFFNGLEDMINGADMPSLPNFGDISLPIDIGGSEGGSFLDTILGILGSIGDLLFGGSDDNGGSGSGSGSGSDSDWGDDWGDDIPDTGDTSFIAVASVVAVAGVAFVLTRKKSDDAE